MKKILKIILIALIVIIFLWLIIFLFDYNLFSNTKYPKFAKLIKEEKNYLEYKGIGYRVEIEQITLENNQEKPQEMRIYLFNNLLNAVIIDYFIEPKENLNEMIALEDLPEKYSILEAINDRCIVDIHGGTIYNLDEFEKFKESIDNKTPYHIRIISFTTEGDMIMNDVEFDGEKFDLALDSTRDEYSSKEDRIIRYYECIEFNTEELENGRSYYLENEKSEKRYFMFVSNDVKIINNHRPLLLEVKESLGEKTQKITNDILEEKYDYDIYYYGLEEVIINIDGEKVDLKYALENDKITMEEILKKAENDAENGLVISDMYKDGGSKIYIYGKYTILKYYSLDGNRDVYIGKNDLNINMF